MEPTVELPPPDHPGARVPVTDAPRRRTRAQAVLWGLVVLTVVAGALVYVLGGSPSPADAVTGAVTTSAADGTVQLAIAGSVSAAGETATFNGSGSVDFVHGAAQLSLTATAAGRQDSAQVVVVGGTLYVGSPNLSALLSGKSWLSVPVGPGGGGTSGGDPLADPANWLSILENHGGQVTPLGPSTVDGTAVQGYSVTFDPSTIEGDLGSLGLPASARSALSKLTVTHAGFTVYVDGTGLVRQLSVDLSAGIGASGPLSVEETTTFSSYGAPVSITAPPPADVATAGELLKGAGAAALPGLVD
jgi:hypothetical protein